MSRGTRKRMSDKSDASLMEWAVKHVGYRARDRKPRWAHVMDMFGFGSTSGHLMCRRFDVDPDEIVGGCSECKYSLGCENPDCAGDED